MLSFSEAADEDSVADGTWNGNCVVPVLLKAKSKQKLPLLPV